MAGRGAGETETWRVAYLALQGGGQELLRAVKL
jgi:hypothetical protein